MTGKFEFTFRDFSGRQIWQTAKGSSKQLAKLERSEVVGKLRKGVHLESTSQTVGDAAALWLERGVGRNGEWQPVSRERYERLVRNMILRSLNPALVPVGNIKLRDLSADDVAAWSRSNESFVAPTTAASALRCLGRICRLAVRRGWIGEDPVGRLEPGERPRWQTKPVAILTGPELGTFLRAAGYYQAIFEFLAFSGLRISEALGLQWKEVDLEAGFVRVARQLGPNRELKEPKTAAGIRVVVIAPEIVELLSGLRTEENVSGDDFVFKTPVGRCMDYTAVSSAFRRTVIRSGLEIDGRFSLHSLRHGYASILISEGLDLLFVGRQLGHAKPTTTLSVYAHFFEKLDHATSARRAVGGAHSAMRSGAAE